ncbi:MAG: NAD-dependent epimerase [Clostridiaceae bacterium]
MNNRSNINIKNNTNMDNLNTTTNPSTTTNPKTTINPNTTNNMDNLNNFNTQNNPNISNTPTPINPNSNILITGAAGFIGFHLAIYLINQGHKVIGIDNINDYYDTMLKEDRLALLKKNRNFVFHRVDLKDKQSVDKIFEIYHPDYVINLAAQAGVRYSITNPYAYVDSNLIGFVNILEACRNYPVKHLLYASSSSVYGGNKTAPFSTNHNVDHPVSLYAATKKADELMAHTYSHLYKIPTTGLRFFTVYGPFGRPDMAYFLFSDAILNDKPIKVFNHGKMERDFTYVDDIVEGIYKLIPLAPEANPDWDENDDDLSSSFAPYKIYNIGNNKPVKLEKFIEVLEKKLGKKATKIYMDMQPGDVVKTYADVSDLEKDIGFKPSTTIEEGIGKFVDWYKEYYEIESDEGCHLLDKENNDGLYKQEDQNWIQNDNQENQQEDLLQNAQ